MLLELARIAVEEHLADPAQVAEAQAHARRTGEPLVVALVDLAHDVAERHRLLPLELEHPVDGPRLLRVAMADPTDHEALALVEASTGCRIEPGLVALGGPPGGVA